MSINEVSKLTGLPPHTIRFYEKQFPKLLNVDRTPGGHRQYRLAHIEALRRIIELLHYEKISIKEAQIRLGEITPSVAVPCQSERGDHAFESNSTFSALEGLQKALAVIMSKLEEISRRNVRIEAILEDLRSQSTVAIHNELLEEIARYREENRRSIRIYEEFLQRGRRVDGNASV